MGQEAMKTKSQPGHAATKDKKSNMQARADQVATSTSQVARTRKTRPSEQQTTTNQVATTTTGQVATTTESISGQVAMKI